MDNAANNARLHVSADDDALAGEVQGRALARAVGLHTDAAYVDDGQTKGTLEERRAPRYSLLIRAAKLVTSHGEFVCVIRDISETGLSVRLFHAVPQGDPVELHMPGGHVFELTKVWDRDREAGFEFTQSVDVAHLINEASEFPKRGMRLGLCFPIRLRTLTQTCEGVVENFSQQGARIECDGRFAIDESLQVDCIESSAGLRDVRAKVRWRRDNHYGVVFDDTLSLQDFARFAARLQDPGLLIDGN